MWTVFRTITLLPAPKTICRCGHRHFGLVGSLGIVTGALGGGVHHTRSQKATIRAFDKFYSWFPSFLDMFPDEEAFVNFAFWFVVFTIVMAFIASRFIKIKPHQI